MKIRCADCRHVRLDPSACEENWNAYECGNMESEYYRALLNVSPDGETQGGKLRPRITWNGCAHGMCKNTASLQKYLQKPARVPVTATIFSSERPTAIYLRMKLAELENKLQTARDSKSSMMKSEISAIKNCLARVAC